MPVAELCNMDEYCLLCGIADGHMPSIALHECQENGRCQGNLIRKMRFHKSFK